MTPPSQSLYLTKAQFVDTFEGWLKGNPEFELHVLGPISSTDTATMVSFQCVGEHAPTGYQWDMNGTNWSSTTGVKVFTQAQMDAMNLAFPGKSYLVLALEDDDTACEIKTDEDRFGAALEALKSAYQSYIGLKDIKVADPGRHRPDRRGRQERSESHHRHRQPDQDQRRPDRDRHGGFGARQDQPGGPLGGDAGEDEGQRLAQSRNAMTTDGGGGPSPAPPMECR